jgi:ubiquinone/menaquinone biosynthesis C-methylase UbiE
MDSLADFLIISGVVFLLLLVSAMVAGALVWRWISRRWSLPCPRWMVPLLENPFVQSRAGAGLLIERAGIGTGMQVLDAGCGPGRVTIPTARVVGSAGSVTAMDVQPQMLQMLAIRASSAGVGNIRTITGGLGEGFLESNAFDRVLLVTVLGEIPEKISALEEIHGSLKLNGVLSITELFPDPHFQTRRKVKKLTKAAGFQVREQFGNMLGYTINLEKAIHPAEWREIS